MVANRLQPCGGGDLQRGHDVEVVDVNEPPRPNPRVSSCDAQRGVVGRREVESATSDPIVRPAPYRSRAAPHFRFRKSQRLSSGKI